MPRILLRFFRCHFGKPYSGEGSVPGWMIVPKLCRPSIRIQLGQCIRSFGQRMVLAGNVVDG